MAWSGSVTAASEVSYFTATVFTGEKPLSVSANATFLCVCVSVKPDTLTDLTNQMTEKVGLVHGLPYVADRQGFAATLEQVGSGLWSVRTSS